ncbi:MAG: hypothetical protein WC076_07010 [Terrimicrobiaceae bacterium]|jgi:hypothetical protein|nr:hypothetical protein [Terrimicrobiaceae bacterium]
METWWHSLVLSLQLFYGTGIVAGIALAIEVVLTDFWLPFAAVDMARAS